MAAAADETVTLDHEVPADPDVVWERLTTDEGFSSWSGAGSRIDPQPGGRIDTPDGPTGKPRAGAVEDIDEHRRLCYRWWPSDDPDTVSTVDISLYPSTIGTRLVVTERRVLPAAVNMQASTAWDGRLRAVSRLPLLLAGS